MYINRDIEKILLDAAESFQVITIYGSRQVGKSTTVDQLFGDNFEPVTLDDAEELDMALSNPRAFFESHPWPLIIDEVLYPVEIKKGIAPSKPTKNFNVLAKYNMPIKQGMVIDNAEKIRVLNDDAFVLPVSLLGY